MHTVLIVSPHFPPSTLAGVHRARHLAKHLPAHGWRPVVIRADPSCYTEQSDPALAALVPENIEQRRTGALPVRLMRAFGIGDIGIRAFFHLRQAVAVAAAELRPNAVLITGSPYYPMLLTDWISRSLRIPVVLDFQDPWVSAHSATLSKWSKGGFAHRLALELEPRALRHAAFITSVSETQNAQMADRYVWLDATRMAAIPIGGDPEDFDALRAQPPSDPQVRIEPDLINLSYVGTLLPRAAPLVRAVFRALAALKQTQPRLAARLRLNFVGTSNQPNFRGPGLVTALAVEAGVGDLVNETPRRVPFLEALSILARSNGILLIGSDEPHYTASKIYPALMSGQPYLSLFHRASSAHRILSTAGGGCTFSFSDVAELSSLEPAISEGILGLATTPEKSGHSDPRAYAAYTAHSVSKRFAEVFEKAAQLQSESLGLSCA